MATDRNGRDGPYGNTNDTPKHTQARAYRILALSMIESALDAIEDGNGEALAWARGEVDGRLPIVKACNAAGTSLRAVREEAEKRHRSCLEDADPIEDDRVPGVWVLERHCDEWLCPKEAGELFSRHESSVRRIAKRHGLESVRAPKPGHGAAPTSFYRLKDLEGLYGEL